MKIRLLLIAFSAVMLMSPLPIKFWQMDHDEFNPLQVPLLPWRMASVQQSGEMDFHQESDFVEITADRIAINTGSGIEEQTGWQSPPDWQVRESFSADLNRDGRQELVMLVWRPFEAWPVDQFLPHGGRIANHHDASGQSCHVILVGWDGEKYRELWAGSALIDPVSHLKAADLDGDGYEELVAIEKSYGSPRSGGNLTVWEWSGFGFRLKSRINGDFSDFGIVLVGQNVMIVTN